MKQVSTAAALLSACQFIYGQSSLIEGPFIRGSGNYTTLIGGDFEAENALSNWGFQGGWAQGNLDRVGQAAQRGLWGGKMTRDINLTWGYACGKGNTAFPQFTVGEEYVLSGFFSPRTYWADGGCRFDLFLPHVGTVASILPGPLTQEMVGMWSFGWTTFTGTSSFLVVRAIHERGFGQNVPADATS